MSLFGTSGIRGVINKELTAETWLALGCSLGTTISVGSRVGIATDTRVSGELIRSSLISGLLSTGVKVTDLGVLPTPALALLTREMGFDAGVMVTASHNPPEYNGLKFFGPGTLGYGDEEQSKIEEIYQSGSFRRVSWEDIGSLSVDDGREKYLSLLIEKAPPVRSSSLRVVVDPGNGAACGLASRLFKRLGFDVLSINNEPSGFFPGRGAEPGEDTLHSTVEFLRKRKGDLAICFDGDADRVVFCDKEGFLGYDPMTAFISRLILRRSQSQLVATTVETGNLLDLAVADLGARVIRGKVGDVNLAYLVRELGAPVGVEPIGVYILPQMGYYPESIFATLILLHGIERVEEIREFFTRLPRLYYLKAKLPCSRSQKEAVMKKVASARSWKANTLDGVRFELEESWMLIRPSGTEPVIRIIVEAPSQQRGEKLLKEGCQIVEEALRWSK
ncbi:MAG TPA: phosphoglucosamine mutase [Dehalococcoidia bacterium]|nr:phosphoglucosamine mutase [Dehalococcoidia bacterium]